MLRAMSSGVSGLRNHQVRIDVLGNNISNVNTIGYKSQRVNFQNQFSQTMRGGAAPSGSVGGTNPSQVGLGMTVGSIDLQMSQGALQITGKATDLAISGEGFFVMHDGVQKVYTRDGQFDFDKMGNLVKTSNGFRVLGWNATEVNGVPSINSSRPPEAITIPKSTAIPPKATDMLKFGGNLSATSPLPEASTQITLEGILGAPSAAAQIANPAATAASFDYPVEFYDSLGHKHTGKLTYTNTSNVANIDMADPANPRVLVPSSSTWQIEFTPDTPARYTGLVSPQTLANLTFTNGLLTGQVLNNLDLNPTADTNPYTEDALPISVALNLDPNEFVQGTAGGSMLAEANGQEAGNAMLSVKMFDSLGNERTGTMAYSRLTEATWDVSFIPSEGFNEPAGVPIRLGQVEFDTRGILKDTSKLSKLLLNPDRGASPMSIDLDNGTVGQATGMTQFASPNSAVLADQNGYPAGELASVSLDSSGTVTGSFTNGRTQTLAQVAVANFSNPAGMASAGDNAYVQSNNSGEAQIGIAGNGGRGTLQSGALEGSNVDLAQTFSDLIVAQRGFQSNSRIISTSDEVLQELMSLKR